LHFIISEIISKNQNIGTSRDGGEGSSDRKKGEKNGQDGGKQELLTT
jgi:hypothetical protein